MAHVSEHKDPARVGGMTESEKKRLRDKQEINWDNTRDRLEKQGKTQNQRLNDPHREMGVMGRKRSVPTKQADLFFISSHPHMVLPGPRNFSPLCLLPQDFSALWMFGAG